jgi:hypothetical protein
MSGSTISRVERGGAGALTLDAIRAVARALEIRIDVGAAWRGGELDRLLNARHSAMHEAVARRFGALPGWACQPEVSFAIYGERGVIDVLGWHPAWRTLLVVELKTEILDVQEMLGTLDRKRRLAPQIVRQKGWYPERTACWLVLAESTMNRRRVAAHATVLDRALPDRGAAVRQWLPEPSRPLAALSFLPVSHQAGGTRRLAPIRRVRTRPAAEEPRGAAPSRA